MYPFSPNLKYEYPAPTKSIISNISYEISHNPSFYGKVLDLMNKMNLSPPFEERKKKNKGSRSVRSKVLKVQVKKIVSEC